MFEPEDTVQFNYQKFKTVVHFICAECHRDELSRYGLHRVLFLSDMLRYVESSEPLTGEGYIRQRFGPAARHLDEALEELTKEGSLTLAERSLHGLLKQDFDSLRPVQTNQLTEADRLLLLDVIALVCGRQNSKLSELNQDEPWQPAGVGERIPYYMAFSLLPASEVTDDDFAWADMQARKLGLVN